MKLLFETDTVKGLHARRGHALLMTLVFAAISLLLLAAMINRTRSSALVSERHNAYGRALNAAESATEGLFAGMSRDFLNQSIDYSKLDPYRTLLPGNYVANGWPDLYEFSDNAGGVNHIGLLSTGPSVVTNLDVPYQGLYGIAFPFRVTSKATQLATTGGDTKPVSAAVQQDFQLASIPVFQFMAFYSLDLEINPSPIMKLTGKVHGNADLYLAPVTGLEFVDAVESTGNIIFDRKPDDTGYGGTKVDPVFDGTHNTNANSLTLPIGTNNSPADVAKVIDPPGAFEDPKSAMGAQRYYNQVDLIVITTQNGGGKDKIDITTGRWQGLAKVSADLPAGEYSFVTTTNSFFDAREGKATLTTEIDVGKFNIWLTNSGPKSGAALNAVAKGTLGHQLNSIYVDDQRGAAGKLTVVRVTNGQQLPPDGLTVATDLPLYVKGNYNATDLTAGSTNTVNTRPASLVGDAITVLSGNWSDAASTNATRTAADTTVNAAFVAGIVQTANVAGTKHYSGGLENFPRFLEKWTGFTLTYNGSMVVMFESRRATGFWGSGGVYSPPIRKWAFDQNFLTQSKLPPCTPQVRKLLRGQWAIVAASP